jgi:hypothetical protein
LKKFLIFEKKGGVLMLLKTILHLLAKAQYSYISIHLGKNNIHTKNRGGGHRSIPTSSRGDLLNDLLAGPALLGHYYLQLFLRAYVDSQVPRPIDGNNRRFPTG